jgi:hypothetical protein
MYIHSHGSLVGRPVDDIKFYKQEISRYTQLSFRRANRFVLLALAGACRCANEHAAESRTSVYLTTENGNMGDTEAVLDQIFQHHQFPMPYNFINTMSNTASFYIAQNLKLFGRNLTFSSKQFSFERGIELLRCDMLGGAVEEALIGGVDEACFSKEQFETRFHLSYEDFDMVEGSSWLMVKADPRNALGEISAIQSFRDLTATLGWLRQASFSKPLVVSYGIMVDKPLRSAIADALPAHAEFNHIAALGYHDSATACGATAFLELFSSGFWMHVNKDIRGQFVVLVLEKY